MDDVLELLKEKQQGEQRQREDSALTKDYASQPAGVMKDVSKPPASAPKQTDIDESDIPFGEEASA